MLVRKGRRQKTKPLKVLLDSGTSATIVNKKFCEKLKCKPAPKTLWKTKGGNFSTNQKVRAIFKLPEFDERKAIEWECHVDDTKGQQSYDMIIGCELLEELGMILDYKQCVMTWEDAEVPMKSTDYEIEETYSMLQELTEPQQVREATSRMDKILAATYDKADLDKVTRLCWHLTPKDRTALNVLLKKYKPLFDGTLGTWNIDPVSIEIKEGSKPYHGKAYPVPHVYDRLLREEVERLMRIGVLRKVNRSESQQV